MRKFLFALIVLLMVLPFLYLPMMSLACRWAFPSLLPTCFTPDHWLRAVSIREGLLSGLMLSCTVSLSATALGFWVSRGLSRHPWRDQLLRTAYWPYALSPVVYAFVLQVFYHRFGIVGTLPGVWLGQLFIAFPFCVLVLTPWWSGRIYDLEDLASTFGGGRLQVWTKVLLPMAAPVLLLCWFQAFLISWFEYGMTAVLGLGRVRTPMVQTYQLITEASPYAAAVACCLLAMPPLVILWLNKRALFRVQAHERP